MGIIEFCQLSSQMLVLHDVKLNHISVQNNRQFAKLNTCAKIDFRVLKERPSTISRNDDAFERECSVEGVRSLTNLFYAFRIVARAN